MAEIEPKTREEKLWNGEDIKPLTREEMYIKHIFDETQTIPDHPITRKEMLMEKAGEGGGGDITIKQLTATENRTYSEEDTAYSPVIVNVPPTPLDDLSVTENGTYNPTSGHGFDEITVNVPLPNNAYLLKSAKDDVVSFSDGSDNFFRTLKAYIEPVQDLHGYDSPWVGGAGKNKLQVTATTQTLNGVTFTVNSDGTVSLSGTATGTFVFPLISGTLSFTSDTIITGGYAEASASKVALRINGSSLVPSEGYTISANTNITEVAIRVNSGFNTNGVKLYPMIRLSSVADATFAPYSNICPISGWDEVNVGVSGKNLIPYVELGILNQTDGSEEDNYENKRTGFIRTLPNTQYTISGLDGSGVSIRIFEYKKNKTYIRNYVSSNITNSVTIQTGAEVGYIRFQGSKNIFTSNAAQCEKGTTATTYEPYNGHTYTIDLDGTRYGGTLDVVSGVLTVDRAEVTPTANSVGVVQDDITYASCLVSGILDNNKCISNEYKHIAQSDTAKVGTFKVYQNNGSVTFVNKGFTNVTTANQILSSTQLVFQIATPITIQLTPTQVKSLLGVNNVWADTGETEVEYFAKEVSA